MPALNPPMLELVQARRGHLPGVDFSETDVQELPYLDAPFDALFCQFGVMLLPDKALGFRDAPRTEAGWPTRVQIERQSDIHLPGCALVILQEQ